LFTLKNQSGIEVGIINYGCTITSLIMPDRDGVPVDIVLGFDHLEGYLNSTHYMGCVIGRFANRIAHGRFTLDDKTYTLEKNLPPHHLHGGKRGLGHQIWNTKVIENESGSGIILSYLSPDGEEGYPGNVRFEAKYFLSNDQVFSIEYKATTDQPTIINLTQHTYFNLSGGNENILNHELMISAEHFLPVDESMIPTGEIKSVEDTPFDFRTAKKIGRHIDLADEQLKIAGGYDHTFVLPAQKEKLMHAATLSNPANGCVLDVLTTAPGMQLYTANFLKESFKGKKNHIDQPRSGVCLETQHFPDAPNQAHFPSVVLLPGETFQSVTQLRFYSVTKK
jgi:aldose 1-epimerase